MPTRKSKPKSKPKAKAKARPKPKAKTTTKAKPKAKPKPQTKPKAKPKAKPKPKPKPKRSGGLDDHPDYALLVAELAPGRHADGMLIITPFGALDDEMEQWLLGNIEGRRSLGRTAFGNLVVFRDLRGRADELGLPNADEACDVAMIDIHYKRMTVLAHSAKSFLDALDQPDWQDSFLRADLYRQAKQRLGDYADDECFCFVPALALGGSDDEASVQRANWFVHQDIIRQT